MRQYAEICAKGRDVPRRRWQNARISVHGIHETTYIELLVMNYPSYVFGSRTETRIRRELLPYFDDLKKVGIIHHDPVTAAQTLNDIYDDVDACGNEPGPARLSQILSVMCAFPRKTPSDMGRFPEEILQSITS